MTSQRIVVDPITRIEGHLRIEVSVDAAGNVVDALSAGTQVRGIEIILRGRDPRDAWAFAQRICGVCTLVHGLASVRAVENALAIKIPENGELIRDLMAGAAAAAGPRHPFLPSAGSGLGQSHPRAGRGSQSGGTGGGENRLSRDLGRLFRASADPSEGPCRIRPARHFRQWVVGPSRLPAGAGG